MWVWKHCRRKVSVSRTSIPEELGTGEICAVIAWTLGISTAMGTESLYRGQQIRPQDVWQGETRQGELQQGQQGVRIKDKRIMKTFQEDEKTRVTDPWNVPARTR